VVLMLDTSSRLGLNRVALYWGLPACLGSSLLGIGTCVVKYKIWFWYLYFKITFSTHAHVSDVFCVKYYYYWCADIGKTQDN
jgi:hypothetical protein